MVKAKRKPTWKIAAALPPRCRAQPSPRSSARCEMKPGHDGPHGGRTRGGYWKFWNQETE